MPVEDLVFMRQGDTRPALVRNIVEDDGRAVNLTGFSAFVHYVRDDGGQPAAGAPVTTRTATVTNAAQGEVTYNWVAADTATVGDFLVEVEVRDAGATVRRTYPRAGYIRMRVSDDLGNG
jgi:hypothetical protein